MQKQWRIYKEWIVKGLYVVLFLLAGVCYLLSLKKNEETPVLLKTENAVVSEEAMMQETVLQETVMLYVHICGAVVSPGVYPVRQGTRLGELVQIAGGVTEEADENACNLAEMVSDGQRIVIPTWEEAKLMQQEQANQAEGKVNINTAGKEELMSLPGIGESKASDIIAYRTKNGKFQTIEDIMQISGIKEAAFQKIQDFIIAE